MTKTKFYPDRDKHILLAAVKKNNQAAINAILAEFARLENRIKQLEKAVPDAPANPEPYPAEVEL